MFYFYWFSLHVTSPIGLYLADEAGLLPFPVLLVHIIHPVLIDGKMNPTYQNMLDPFICLPGE